MSTVRFQHGPVVVTIEGLPECVAAEGVKVDLGLRFSPDHYPDPAAAFAECFVALGGKGTFAMADAAHEFSCMQVRRGQAGGTSVLQMYPGREPKPERFDVIADALAVDAAVNTAGPVSVQGAVDAERANGQQR